MLKTDLTPYQTKQCYDVCLFKMDRNSEEFTQLARKICSYFLEGKLEIALHKAAYFGKQAWCDRVLRHAPELIHAPDEFGETILHKSAAQGHLELVQWLAAQGAPINQQDNLGQTPLHKAMWRKRYAISQYLRDHGALDTIKDHKGRTPSECLKSPLPKYREQLTPDLSKTGIVQFGIPILSSNLQYIPVLMQ